jgi:hypothetical protein
MKNAIVWGLEHESISPAIIGLEAQGILNIRAWIGETGVCSRCTHDITSFFAGTFARSKYHGCEPDVYKHVYTHLFTFMDMFTRREFPYDDKHIHDYLNMFNMFLDFFNHLIISEEIKVVIFANIPHEGPDLILYEIAKKRGIQTICFYQSLFPNKFFYMLDLDDFGEFCNDEVVVINEHLKIEKRYKKELFYMNDIPTKKKIPCFDWGKLGRLLEKLKKITGEKKTALSKFVVRRYVRYQKVVAYNRNLVSTCVENVSLEAQYVYFPLHLQPELTTSALGGIYADQVLAIERLANLLPPDWFIYVKENPKQTEFMRSQWFFDRLKMIDKVKLVSPQFNTYVLMENCAFVATITGTAGWEAISGGKNALIFGNAWYKRLPGVFQYDDEFKLTDILNYKIIHHQLEAHLSILASKMGSGVIDPAYIVMVDNFSIEDNTKNIIHVLKKLLQHQC